MDVSAAAAMWRAIIAAKWIACLLATAVVAVIAISLHSCAATDTHADSLICPGSDTVDACNACRAQETAKANECGKGTCVDCVWYPLRPPPNGTPCSAGTCHTGTCN